MSARDAAFTIRDATDDDLAAITAIYEHHVRHGLGSFEEEPPPLAEIARRRADVLARGLPYIVAAGVGGSLFGYAYGAPYRARSAYRFTVEDSIYVAPHAARRGIGRLLLEALIECCTKVGYRQMIAVIGDSGNDGSIGLHQSLGFVRAALLPTIGFKQGRWIDCVMMQRPLGPGSTSLPQEIPPP